MVKIKLKLRLQLQFGGLAVEPVAERLVSDGDLVGGSNCKHRTISLVYRYQCRHLPKNGEKAKAPPLAGIGYVPSTLAGFALKPAS